MTSTRYFVARVAQAFGFVRRQQRMADAASEMHLLREAEAQLGAAIWQKTENIEALSVEYWNLRKLVKEREEIRARLAACQERLDRAHEERSKLLNTIPEENEQLLDERAVLLQGLEKLSNRRDEIIAEAREVRRSYIGYKMKLEVLVGEARTQVAKQQEIGEVKARLTELKERFAELKEQRIKVGEEILAGDEQVDQVDEQLKDMRNQRRLMASEAFQVIGEGNKEISGLRAESALIDTQMRQLYAEIGRYVSRNTHQNSACAAAAASHQNLVEVMRALRRSVAYNHRLAGNNA